MLLLSDWNAQHTTYVILPTTSSTPKARGDKELPGLLDTTDEGEFSRSSVLLHFQRGLMPKGPMILPSCWNTTYVPAACLTTAQYAGGYSCESISCCCITQLAGRPAATPGAVALKLLLVCNMKGMASPSLQLRPAKGLQVTAGSCSV